MGLASISSWYGSNETLIQNILIAALLAFSVQVALRTGIFSLAGIGFYAIGSYTAALLVKKGWSTVEAMAAATALTIVLGYALAVLLVRLRDLYLAMATFAFDLMVGVVAGNWNQVTGGALGVTGIPLAYDHARDRPDRDRGRRPADADGARRARAHDGRDPRGRGARPELCDQHAELPAVHVRGFVRARIVRRRIPRAHIRRDRADRRRFQPDRARADDGDHRRFRVVVRRAAGRVPAYLAATPAQLVRGLVAGDLRRPDDADRHLDAGRDHRRGFEPVPPRSRAEAPKSAAATPRDETEPVREAA